MKSLSMTKYLILAYRFGNEELTLFGRLLWWSASLPVIVVFWVALYLFNVLWLSFVALFLCCVILVCYLLLRDFYLELTFRNFWSVLMNFRFLPSPPN